MGRFQTSLISIILGDGTYYDLKNSRALPISLWLVLFVMPFLLLTVLSNVTDLCFLMRHPSVLIFGKTFRFLLKFSDFFMGY